jgi:hypothetical protein
MYFLSQQTDETEPTSFAKSVSRVAASRYAHPQPLKYNVLQELYASLP